MRPELETIETIERYLQGELSSEEKEEFEKRLEQDADLRQAVDEQRELMEGIRRSALRSQVKKAHKQYKLWQQGGTWGLSLLGVALIGTFLFFFLSPFGDQQKVEDEELSPWTVVDSSSADADQYVPSQHFRIDGSSDTVVETEQGIAIAVPEGAFVKPNGEPVEKELDLEVKEALKPSDIMKAGLSTTSGDKPLETGGMFYIGAQKDGDSLRIDPDKELTARVPTDERKPGMKLYQGVREPDGSIDWQDPEPIPNLLSTVDIHSLDFYPPAYEDSLAAWGYDLSREEWKDSLYYSFSFKTPSAPSSSESDPQVTDPSLREGSQGDKVDTAFVRTSKGIDRTPQGIDPAKVKTIWSDKFQNTLIATEAFEKRMPSIHRSCKEEVLDLYVKNIDQPMHRIDSMAAKRTSGAIAGRFEEFAARKDGKVPKDSGTTAQLNEHYRQKSKAYAEAIRKTQKEFWEKQRELNRKASQKEASKEQEEAERKRQNRKKELEENIEEVYEQMGKEPPQDDPASAKPPENSYQVDVSSTGWKNIDREVEEQMASGGDVEVSRDGDTATIEHEALTVQVKNAKSYDRLYVYLVSDALPSFIRMERGDSSYVVEMNSTMSYSLACVGYKGDAPYLHIDKGIQAGNHEFTLSSVEEDRLDQKLDRLGGKKASDEIVDDLEYRSYMKANRERRQRNQKKKEFTDRLRPVIFPCDRSGEGVNK